MKQNRRLFLGRFLGGVSIAAAAVGTASALVKSPASGLKVLPSRVPLTLDPPSVVIREEWWERPVEWLGDPLDHKWPLSWWASGPPYTISEYMVAMEFHMGLQWPASVTEARMRDGRPTLVVNMIAGVVQRAIIVSRELGEPTDLTDSAWRSVFVNAYRRNKDAQLHYNAMNSARLEMMMLQPKRVTGYARREKGHTFYELTGPVPPKAGIRSFASVDGNHYSRAIA